VDYLYSNRLVIAANEREDQNMCFTRNNTFVSKMNEPEGTIFTTMDFYLQ